MDIYSIIKIIIIIVLVILIIYGSVMFSLSKLKETRSKKSEYFIAILIWMFLLIITIYFCLIFFGALFSFIIDQLNLILNFLKLDKSSILFTSIVMTMAFLLLISTILIKTCLTNRNGIKKIWEHAKQMNWFLYIAIYLILLISTITIAISSMLVSSNFTIEDKISGKINNTLINFGDYSCKSERYSIPVKNDVLNCKVTVKNNLTSVLMLRFCIDTNKCGGAGPGESTENNIQFYTSSQNIMEKQELKIRLPNESEYKFKILLLNNIPESDYSQDYYFVLEEPSIAYEKDANKRNNIFSILILSLPVIIFGVFGGINSLREIWFNIK